MEDISKSIQQALNIVHTCLQNTSQIPVKLCIVIQWLSLNEKCYVNMSQNLNHYVVIKDGKGLN